jgi:hypothetical protein
MNAIARRYWNRQTIYEELLAQGDVKDLVHYLERAVQAEDEQRKRWSEGKVTPGDLGPDGDA